MDAKDLLIDRLKALLQSNELLLQSKEEQLDRMCARLQEQSKQVAAITEQYTQRIDEKDHRIALLEQKIKKLLSTVRGSRQERVNPDQLLLFSTGELQEIADEISSQKEDQESELDTPAESNDPEKPKAKRRKLPQSLPKEIRRHELSEELRNCPCCGELRCEMGVDISQQIEFVPSVFKIIEHQRVQYACKKCQENVEAAPKPPQPIEKGLPGPGLCAYVVLSKFGDHLPLYREEDMLG